VYKRQVSHNLNPSEGTVEIAFIPFLKIHEVEAFCKGELDSGMLSKIAIPLKQQGKEFLAVEIHNEAMKVEEGGITTGDILIAKRNPKLNAKKLSVGVHYVFVLRDMILFRQLVRKGDVKIELKSWNDAFYNEEIPVESITEVLEAEKVIKNAIEIPKGTAQRLHKIEQDIKSLQTRIDHDQ